MAEQACVTIQNCTGAWLGPGLAIVLDMDGVVIDSNPVHRLAWCAYNRRFGIETDEQMLERMYGRRNDEIVRDFFGPHLSLEDVRNHGAAKEALYREMMAGSLDARLVPGVKEFLARHRGRSLALATNAEPANVNWLLDSAGLRPYFQVVVDGSGVSHPKPDPEIYLTVSGRLGVPPADCIVFEDSLAGVAAARAAGMRTVGIRTTHGELPGVDLAVDNFRSTELRAWLRSQKAAD